jgi:hypothetical protein
MTVFLHSDMEFFFSLFSSLRFSTLLHGILYIDAN